VADDPAALGYFVGADLLRQGARALIDSIAH
jgi:hydroxymethylbilane synthase